VHDGRRKENLATPSCAESRSPPARQTTGQPFTAPFDPARGTNDRVRPTGKPREEGTRFISSASRGLIKLTAERVNETTPT